MHSARFILPLLPLLGCDEAQRTSERDISVPLTIAADDYACPQDAETDGYLMAPAPAGLVSVTLWTCYPTDAYGGTFSEGCLQEAPTLLRNGKEGGGDYLRARCDEGTIRIDWLILAE